MLNKKLSLKRSILIFYLLVFLFSMFRSSFYGIYQEYLVSFLGFPISYITLIKLINPITITAFEIPSGILADRYGRKLSFVLASALGAVGLFIYSIASSLSQAMLGEIFFSLGIAFYTGSLRAIIIAKLKDQEKISISYILSKEFAISTIGILLGGSLGIRLFKISPTLVWVVGSIGYALTSLLAVVLLKEENRIKMSKGFDFIKEASSNLSLYFKNRAIVGLTIIYMGIAFINVPFFSHWQRALTQNLGISVNSSFYEIIYISFTLLMALGSIALPFLNKKFNNKSLLYFTAISISLTTIVFALSKNMYIGLGIFFVSEFLRGLLRPSLETIFNKQIPYSDKLSFFMSTLSLSSRACSIFSYFLTFNLARTLGARFGDSFLIYSLSFIGLMIILIGVYKTKRAIK